MTSKTLTLRRIGNSVGVTLPKPMLDELHWTEGSDLTAVRTPEGILLRPREADFDQAMAVYREGAARYRNALRELAK